MHAGTWEPDAEVSTVALTRRSFTAPSLAFWLGLCLVPALYWSTLSGGYLSDDFWWMTELRSKGPWSVWTMHSPFFRPVAAYQMWLFDRLAGGDPWLLRLVNLLLMLGSAVLVRYIAIRMAKHTEKTTAGWIGTVAGLIFAYFSSHSEPVCWVCCICDTNCLFWGLAGILSFYNLTQNRVLFSKLFLGLLTCLCFALSMASKETGVVFPPVLVLLMVFVIVDRPIRKHLGQIAVLSIACLLMMGAYFWVHKALDIAWGYGGLFSESRPILETNLSLDLPNTFLPFAKWLAAYDPGWLDQSLVVLGLAFACLIIWRWGSGPPKRPLTGLRAYAANHKDELILGWIIAIYAITFLSPVEGINIFFWTYFAGIVIGATAMVKYGWYKIVWVRTVLFAIGLWYLFPSETLILYQDFGIFGAWDMAPGKFSAAMLLFYVYLHRLAVGSFGDQERAWAKASLASIVCAALLLAPAATVAFVYLDGRGQRFSYEASAFSAIAWSMLLFAAFGSHRSFLRIGVVGFLAMLAMALGLNNREWAYAGRISSVMAKNLRELVRYKPRRIYMLSEVAFVGGAEALNNGDQSLVSIDCPGATTQIQAACKQWGVTEGDHLEFTEGPSLVFTPSLKQANVTHFDTDHLIEARKGENHVAPFAFFEVTPRNVITILGYQRGDVIAYLDGDDFKIVRWDH